VGEVIATVGGVVSGVPPMPVTDRERLSPSAVKLTFEVTVALLVGVKRTMTSWVAPGAVSVKGLPETTLKGAEADTLPETEPVLFRDTVNVRSAELPTLTVAKSVVPVGVTPMLGCAAALATAEHGLSAPLVFTAVTAA
jgi:hypothetical protein